MALIVVGATAAIICVRVVQGQALRQAEGGGEVVATRIVAPLVTQGVVRRRHRGAEAAGRSGSGIRKSGSTIQRVKVWSADGVILYCDDPRLIGQRYPLEPEDKAVLDSGGVDSDISDLSKSENVLDRGFGESLEVYVGDPRHLGPADPGRDVLHRRPAARRRGRADPPDHPGGAGRAAVLGLLLVPLAYSLARRVARYERERQAMIRLAVEASSAERRRVAGELHDGVIQDLAGVGYALTALDAQIAGLGNSERLAAGRRAAGDAADCAAAGARRRAGAARADRHAVRGRQRGRRSGRGAAGDRRRRARGGHARSRWWPTTCRRCRPRTGPR